jgi:hypothetical protein
MRLGQLARKLAIRPSQIVDFLSSHQIYLEEGSNAKLYDEHVDRIVQYFAPDRLNEIEAEIRTEAVTEKKEALVGIVEPTLGTENLKTENVESVTSTNQEKPEVIKAPKVELSGLKVLGKIELIEPKKKEKLASSEETKTETQEKVRPGRKQIPIKEKKETAQQPWRNPIALQRERDAREAEEKKREAAEREKEKRKEHYLKKVKVGQPTKPARIFDEALEPQISHMPEKRRLSIWGRFMKWLNG